MSACLSNFAAPADSNSASNEDAQQRINREATTVSGRLCIEATAVSRLGICSSKCHILLGDTRAGSLSDNSSWPQRSDSRVLTANLCSNRARPATLRYASVSRPLSGRHVSPRYTPHDTSSGSVISGNNCVRPKKISRPLELRPIAQWPEVRGQEVIHGRQKRRLFSAWSRPSRFNEDTPQS